jgi:transposase-like protein
MGINGDRRTHSNTKSALTRHSLYRGVYSRVARQLGVDRSFVSRVANGQRRSAKVEAALRKEIARIERLLKG